MMSNLNGKLLWIDTFNVFVALHFTHFSKICCYTKSQHSLSSGSNIALTLEIYKTVILVL